MAYVKQTWTNGSTTTPLNATRMNYIESGIEALNLLDNFPLSIPGTITWTGTAWPARTTVTSQLDRRVFFIGNPGGAAPTDMQPNDIWAQG